MKRDVVIAGIGPGAEAQMTLALVDACEQADVLIGAGRMTKAVEKYQKPMLAEYSPEKIYEYLKAHPEYEKIVLLQSGDVGFYSGAKKLQAVLAEDADFSVRVEPGISSLVYFCAKIGVSWEDAAFVSLHGQHCNFLETVRRNRKTLAIAGGKGSVREICQTLSSYGWEQIVLHVGTDLSYPEEQIVTGTPFELAKMEFAPLAVLLFENPNPEPEFTAGMADEVFLRDKVPMTKREVRNASLSHLQLSLNSVVYDIGSGTGSVSIEMALRAAQGKVYAIEKIRQPLHFCRKIKRNLQWIIWKLLRNCTGSTRSTPGSDACIYRRVCRKLKRDSGTAPAEESEHPCGIKYSNRGNISGGSIVFQKTCV